MGLTSLFGMGRGDPHCNGHLNFQYGMSLTIETSDFIHLKCSCISYENINLQFNFLKKSLQGAVQVYGQLVPLG